MSASDTLDEHTVRRIAVEAARDPRTVRAVLAGRHVSPLARAAVQAALDRLGLAVDGIADLPRTRATG